MASETTICNLALSHCGSGLTISSLTQKIDAARACNQFYETTRDEMLREYAWGFATRMKALSPVGDTSVGYSAAWFFANRYPAEALYLQGIISAPTFPGAGVLGATLPSGIIDEIPYEVQSDNAGSLILTNLRDAWVKYTHRETTVEFYPPDFQMAFSLRLAAYIMPRVAKGDVKKLGERSFQLFMMSIEKARATSAREGLPNLPSDSDMIRARG